MSDLAIPGLLAFGFISLAFLWAYYKYYPLHWHPQRFDTDVDEVIAQYSKWARAKLRGESKSVTPDAREAAVFLEQYRGLDVVDRKTKFALGVAAALATIQGFAVRSFLDQLSGGIELTIGLVGLALPLLAAAMALMPGMIWVGEEWPSHDEVRAEGLSGTFLATRKLVEEKRRRIIAYRFVKTAVLTAIPFVIATYLIAFDHIPEADGSEADADPTRQTVRQDSIGPFQAGSPCETQGVPLDTQVRTLVEDVAGLKIGRVVLVGSTDVVRLSEEARNRWGTNIGLARGRARCVADRLGPLLGPDARVEFRARNASDFSNRAAANGKAEDRWVRVVLHVQSDPEDGS